MKLGMYDAKLGKIMKRIPATIYVIIKVLKLSSS